MEHFDQLFELFDAFFLDVCFKLPHRTCAKLTIAATKATALLTVGIVMYYVLKIQCLQFLNLLFF